MKKRILLVDDEKDFVEALAERLKSRDFDVTTAFSGEEALNTLESHQNTDVVILDVKMPGMDGIETLGKIRLAFPLTEVIMLTGHGTLESAIEGMKWGAFDYLMKPCEIEQLMAKVQQATLKRRDHEEKIKEARIREALSGHGLG